MNRFLTILPAVLLLAACCETSSHADMQPVDYVSTLVGTASVHELSTGNTYPATAVPWGMNFWTPQTGPDGDGWCYTYFDTRIRGLKQTHQPSPWMNDYGTFSIMPVTTGPVFDENERASWFSHKAETATPYYYSVYLAEHDVLAELAPTSRAASCRLTYPEKDISYLVVDAFPRGSKVEIQPGLRRIVGYTTFNSGGVADGFRNWFVVESDTPFEMCSTIADGISSDALEAVSEHSLALVGFPTEKGQQVNLRIASSFISQEQAILNLEELGGHNVDEVASEGRRLWNEALGRIEVEDGNIDNLRTFYSCLYRSLLFPRDLSEIDASGRRVHYSPHTGDVHEGYLFTDTGFWDTFRGLFPLMNLVYPDMSAKVQEGLVNHFLESGMLPEWSSPGHRDCMVGNNSASVVADAYLSGIRGYDIEKLWEAVTYGAHHDRTATASGRRGWKEYDSLGYVPCDIGLNESAARTLEYAYDDWCIYQLGKALGKDDEELEPYRKAASNWKNIYNPQYRLMQGRRADGQWNEPFSPLKWGGDFTEGNSLHYTWSVFHDVPGLMEAMGGEQSFSEMLDSVFAIPPIFDDSYYGSTIHEIREMQIMNMGNYAHGNQPIQHMLYLYDWCGQPWKTQARVREVMDKFYNSNFDGYCGDEDNGQTSAWYVFSAMGFYPVCPGSGQYALGSPLFRNIKVNRPDGVLFRVEAANCGKDNVYVKSLKVGGNAWDHNYITASQLLSGKTLKFEMSDEPNYKRVNW